MLKLEIKKLIKSNTLIITIIFGFVMALYINYRSNNIGSLDIEYPSFEDSSTISIFIMMFNEQINRFDNRAQIAQEFNSTFSRYARESYSKLQHFLVNLRTYSFPEMYKQGKFIQKLDYNCIQEVKEYMNKYPFMIKDEDTKKTFDYGIMESEYYHDNDILFTRVSEELLSTNYARRIVYNSRIIFGVPYFAFIIICFFGVLSREFEKGTITLLRTQPKSIRNILYSKILPIILNSFIYIFSFLVFFYIICLVQGINLGGFRDIFRIYNIGEELKYIKAYQLIPLILLSFVVLNILFASIIIFINVITRSDGKTLSILIVLGVLMYTLTENLEVFQNRYNPIFAIDHVRSLIGTTKEIVEADGTRYYQYIYQGNLFYLLAFVIISYVVIEASNKLFNHNIKLDFIYENRKKTSNNILLFEINKLIRNGSFVIYLIGAVVFIFSIYSFNIKDVNDKLNFEVGDNGDIKVIRDRIKQITEDIEFLGEEKSEYLILDLEDNNKRYDLKYNINKYYKSHDSRKFYEYLNERDNTHFDYQATSYYAYKNGKPNVISKLETNIINAKSIEENIKPIYRRTFANSEYDKFTTALIEKESKKNEIYLTNSSLYSNFKMLKYQDLDIIFMILVLFMVISGYTIEKSYRKNLNLIYTQAISKVKYHLIKILSQAIVIVGVYIFISFFIFLIGVLVEGVGEFKQPIIEYLKLTNKPNAIRMDEVTNFVGTIPIYIYLLRTLLVIVMQALLLSSIATLISIFTKNRGILITVSSSIYIIGYLINSIVNINAFKLFNPFSYIFINQIADNSVMVRYKIFNASFVNSVLIIFGWSVITSIIGALIAKYKYQKV